MLKNKIFTFCIEIENIYRSVTGTGNIKTLNILKKYNPNLKIIKFASGKKIFDWKVPKVWSIKDAWIKEIQSGKKIISFKKNMLSVVGFSKPVHIKKIKLNNFSKRIHTLKKQPNVTPYVTSYYKKDYWGFCAPEKIKKKLKNTFYEVKIDSKFSSGSLSIGEILIKGRIDKEILISTYICHPKMASNEISGPAIAIFLSKWIQKLKKRKFSYRIVFSSETVGTIAYINKNLGNLKEKVIGGYVLTCLGDDKYYSYLKSKNGNSISDKIAIDVLKKMKGRKKIFNWINRGSDERQYNSPNVELNIGSLMRSKYGTFKEYHTDSDKLGTFVNKKNLFQSFNFVKAIIYKFEKEIIPITPIFCEPFLLKKNLYSSISKKDNNSRKQKIIRDILSYSNGNYTLKEISNLLRIDYKKIFAIAKILKRKKLIFY